MELFLYIFVTYLFGTFEHLLFFIGAFKYLKRKNNFLVRLIIYLVLYFGILLLLSYLLSLYLLNSNFTYNSSFYVSFIMKLTFILFYISGLFLLFDEDITKLIFLLVSLFASKDIFNGIYDLTITLNNYYSIYVFIFDTPNYESIILYFVYLFSLTTLFYFLFIKIFNKNKYVLSKKTLLYILLIYFFNLIYVLVLSNGLIFKYNDDDNLTLIYYLNVIFIDLLFLIILRFILYWLNDINEKNELNKLKDMNLAQLEALEKNMDLINIKCHDLKHQVNTIFKNREDNKDYFDDINNIINIYDSTINTGNKKLDVILTSKSLECEVNKIEFRVILDGKILSFISLSDLNSLFGNAIDNAIESLKKEKEENRYLLIQSKTRSGFYIIHIENYFSSFLNYDKKGNILTKKEDSLNHGFGIKSMKNIMKTYKGSLEIEVKDNTFEIDLFFPLDLINNPKE